MTNVLDAVIVLTLRRSIDRQEAFLGAALQPLCGMPYELIKFFIGIDGKDYEDDMTAVANAAVADGFGFVEEYALGTTTEFVQQTAGSVAQLWGFARILRHIVETQQTALVVWDDKTLKVPFGFFLDVLAMLTAEEKKFYIWQLTLRGTPKDIQLPDQDAVARRIQSQAIFSALFSHTIESPLDFLIIEGLRGYDESMVFSPAGAEWMLKRLETATEFHTFLDHFICHELAALTHNDPKKGFYAPAEYGFNFVDVLRPMGTLTNWAPKDSEHFSESKRHLKPTYI